jgi:ABC-type methionine transport system ATPase subunit
MLQNLNGYYITAIIGKSGSGKTSTLINWLTAKGKKRIWNKVFNNVYVVMPQSSRESLVKNPFKKHTPSRLFEEMTLTNLQGIYNELLENSERGESSLLILDDVGSALKNKDIKQMMKTLFWNKRHLKVHIVLLIQSYISLERDLRKGINNMVLFKPNKIEFSQIFDELLEKDKHATQEVFNYAYKQPHDSLFININSQRIFKNFDEIIILEDENENNIQS